MQLVDASHVVFEFLAARWRFRRLRGDALRAWQDRHGRASLSYARAHSAFWRAWAEGVDDDGWRSLPVVDKRLLTTRWDDWNTVGVRAEQALPIALAGEEAGDGPLPDLHGHTVLVSSGTSGRRSLSIVSRDERVRFIGWFLARMLDGVLLRRPRIALLLRSNSKLYQQIDGTLASYRWFDLRVSARTLRDEVARYQPTLLVGPPTVLAAVARVPGGPGVRPDVVFSAAEVLEPEDRAAIEAAFGARVRNMYHTSESPIALPCRHGRMHLQEDVTAVDLQPIGDGRFVPIVTSLFRRAQPMLRYRMDDIVTLDDAPCPCGSAFRVLAHVEGRRDDALLVPDADGLREVFPDAVRQAVVVVAGVDAYRVVQSSPTHVRVELDVPADAEFDAVAATVIASLRRLLGAPVALDAVHGVEPESDPRQKRRRVRRLFTPADAAGR
jgi:putative adenylate-forming enzyme